MEAAHTDTTSILRTTYATVLHTAKNLNMKKKVGLQKLHIFSTLH